MEGNGSCRAGFLRKHSRGGAGTPSVIACGDATFPKGTAFGGNGKVSGITQRRPLGGAAERSEAEGVHSLQAERISYFFASFIRLRFSSRMRSSTTFTALRMRALGMRTASVAHG